MNIHCTALLREQDTPYVFVNNLSVRVKVTNPSTSRRDRGKFSFINLGLDSFNLDGNLFSPFFPDDPYLLRHAIVVGTATSPDRKLFEQMLSDLV
jgi:hypothetical protein